MEYCRRKTWPSRITTMDTRLLGSAVLKWAQHQKISLWWMRTARSCPMRLQQPSTPSWQRLYRSSSSRELGRISAWRLHFWLLTTQVRSPDIEDWEKLCHLMEYLRGDRNRPLILGADNEGMLMWYDDALFAVHPNMCGHTGGGMTMGRGFPISVSTKQKLNTKSSTESELVGIENMMPIILWTWYFLLSQGYGVIENLLLQDNKSSILLKTNGKATSGKRTRYINMCYFFIMDWVNMKELTIKWCPTEQMVTDFMMKPIQGSHFRHLSDYIMRWVRGSKPKIRAVNVDKKINNKKKKVNGKGHIKVVAK